MTPIRTKLATLAVGASLIGGGLLTTGVLASPAHVTRPLSAAMQSTPSAAGQSTDSTCVDTSDASENESLGTPVANGDQSTAENENDGAGKETDANDDSQSATSSDGENENDSADTEQDSTDDSGAEANGQTENENDATGNETETADDASSGTDAIDDVQPGQLDEGKDLLPQAKVTLDQAVTAATAAAQGSLGDVDLKTVNGALVFQVTVGNQLVSVSATDGSVVSVGPDDNSDNGCDAED